MQYTNYNDIKINDVEHLDLWTNRLRIPQVFQSYKYLIEDKYTGRPDKFCQDLYGTTEMQWIVCRMNDIENPLEFNSGMIIWVPSQDEMWRFIDMAANDPLVEGDFDEYIDEVESVSDETTEQKVNKKQSNNKVYVKVDKLNGRLVF